MDKDSEFNVAMNLLGEELYSLLKQKDEIEKQIDVVREKLPGIFAAYNRDEWNNRDAPLIITNKLVSTSERMKKGGKAILKEMITEFEWSEIYNPPGEKVSLRVMRRDKIRERE